MKYQKISIWYGDLKKNRTFFLIRYLLWLISVLMINVLFGFFTNLVWWGITFPLIIWGYLFSVLDQFKNIFIIGFISGFIIWFGGNILFSFFYETNILLKIGAIMTQYSFVIFIVAGLIGGSINGLSLYIGKLLFNILKK